MNNKMVKIAFGFERRVGKDTSCDYLISKYGGLKLSFAEPLYNILYFAQDICHFERCKDRKFLQYIGTEWARTIKNDVWVNLLITKVRDNQNHKNIFVSDLRFENEFQALKAEGFICVQIQGNKEQHLDGYENHQSDMELKNFNGWDYTLDNSGNLENLYEQLDLLFLKIQNQANKPSE